MNGLEQVHKDGGIMVSHIPGEIPAEPDFRITVDRSDPNHIEGSIISSIFTLKCLITEIRFFKFKNNILRDRIFVEILHWYRFRDGRSILPRLAIPGSELFDICRQGHRFYVVFLGNHKKDRGYGFILLRNSREIMDFGILNDILPIKDNSGSVF